MRHLISLGRNCDVAFQLRMHGPENIPHFFDWLGTPAEGLIKIIEDDFDCFHAEDMEYVTDSDVNFVRDGKTGVVFFHQFPWVNFHICKDFLLFFKDFQKTIRFQARRFREYANTLPLTLVRRDITKETAERLERVFYARFPNADARFLYLINDKSGVFVTEHGHARYLPETKYNLGEPDTWVDIMLAENMLFRPFNYSTLEILGLSGGDHALSPDDRFSEDQLLRAVDSNPQHPLFALEAARHFRRRGSFARGAELAERSLSLKPELADAKVELTICKWRLGAIDAETAVNSFKSVYARGTHFEALQQAADVQFSSSEFVSALELSISAISIDPMRERPYYICAMSKYHLGDIAGALRAMSQAIRVNDREQAYYHLQSRFYDELGKASEAIAAEVVCLHKGGGLSSHCHIGELYRRSGDFEKARAHWEKALTLAGDKVDVVQGWLNELDSRSPSQELAAPAETGE